MRNQTALRPLLALLLGMALAWSSATAGTPPRSIAKPAVHPAILAAAMQTAWVMGGIHIGPRIPLLIGGVWIVPK